MLQIAAIENPVIHIVGAGGTGGFAFTNLTRLLAGTNIPIHLYDGDIVEPKNLKRQQFSQTDVGVNKAAALMENATNNILSVSPVASHPYYITDVDDFVADILVETGDGTPIIISAVDNVSSERASFASDKVSAASGVGAGAKPSLAFGASGDSTLAGAFVSLASR